MEKKQTKKTNTERDFSLKVLSITKQVLNFSSIFMKFRFFVI